MIEHSFLILYKSVMRKVGNGRSQRGAPRLEALYRKLAEDHLGEAPIRHGDSVIIKK
jgi:hypothetical protein